jgi:molybdenum cofactor cytidylyltransferase
VGGQAVTVVVGAHASELTPLLKRSSASWVLNRAWEEGVGSSIRAGVAALPVGCEAVLILLGDQIAVSADDLKRLVSAWNGESTVIAAAQYDQQTGVPAIFPAFCFSELSALRGDQGAKAVLHRHRDRVVRVAMPNAAVDLDTPHDLQVLTERFGSAGE